MLSTVASCQILCSHFRRLSRTNSKGINALKPREIWFSPATKWKFIFHRNVIMIWICISVDMSYPLATAARM